VLDGVPVVVDKAPRVYVRESGLLHQLAGIADLEVLPGHPLCGPSWEGFVLESTLAQLPSTWRASYYRTRAQAEIDLVLEGPRKQVLAVEIKRTLSPSLTRGFHRQVKHTSKRGLVAVGRKLSEEVAPGTLNSIPKQAGLKQ
jgi:predicted AAA+ superfamily ATPase